MSDIMALWVILRVEIVHGRHCTMSMEFIYSFMRRCWKNSMDNVQGTLSTHSMDSMDIVHTFHGFHGHCPHIPWRCWKNFMDNVHSTLDIVHGFHGHCPHIPWIPWTLSTHYMASMDNVHGFRGKYPGIPWKMSRMSTLQTGRASYTNSATLLCSLILRVTDWNRLFSCHRLL